MTTTEPSIAGLVAPKVDAIGTVTVPADLTACSCGDLTREGRHSLDGSPCGQPRP